MVSLQTEIELIVENRQKPQLVGLLNGLTAGVVGHVGQVQQILVIGQVDQVDAEFV